MLSERKIAILDELVRAYTHAAEPVSSAFVARQMPFPVSSATVRNDMLALEEEGFLQQPHTSAGRIPTAQAFRFVVEQMLGRSQPGTGIEERFGDDIASTAHLIAKRVRAVAFVSSGNRIAFSGFEFVLTSPELQEVPVRAALAQVLDETSVWGTRLRDALERPIEAFIGDENPIRRCEYFSIVAAHTPQGGILAVLGPLRMHYDRAIRAFVNFTRA